MLRHYFTNLFRFCSCMYMPKWIPYTNTFHRDSCLRNMEETRIQSTNLQVCPTDIKSSVCKQNSPFLYPLQRFVLILEIPVFSDACYLPVYVCLFVCFPGITTHCGCIFTARYRALASSCSRILDHTQRRATVFRTPLDG
jgi:hypothetical protein